MVRGPCRVTSRHGLHFGPREGVAAPFVRHLPRDTTDMFETTIAGSLPKPSWLAETNKLWPQWKLTGEDLAEGKRDATLLWIKSQEDAGIDVVSDGEQSRQHFVHGFLESVEGIDFEHKVKMGIRNNRYDAMVPVVVGKLRLRGRVHEPEAQVARAHTRRQLKITMPGPMTIVDTIADSHYGDKVKMAMAFAELLNQEARALEAQGVDVIQFDEPAFNVYMDDVKRWGIDALHRAIEGLQVPHRGAHLLRLRHQGQHRLEKLAGRRVAAVRGNFPGAREKPPRSGLRRVHPLARADQPAEASRRQGRAGRRDRRGDRQGRDARGDRRGHRARRSSTFRRSGCIPAPIAAWPRWRATSPRPSSRRSVLEPSWRAALRVTHLPLNRRSAEARRSQRDRRARRRHGEL